MATAPNTQRPPQQLPTNPESGGCTTYGHATPCNDTRPQQVSVPARRVLPIVFLPGIMGSNLRMSAARQRQLGKKSNLAWRPDKKLDAAGLIDADAQRRQLQLDPSQTEVDTFDGPDTPTGDPNESAICETMR